MQGTIDGMAAELRRTKSQLEETQTIGQGLALLSKQVTVSGDTIKFNGDVGGMPFELTVKKAT